MATTKAEKLALIEKHGDFLMEVAGFAVGGVLMELNRKGMIKPDPKTGKKPNAGACHPAFLSMLRRDIELQLDLTGNKH